MSKEGIVYFLSDIFWLRKREACRDYIDNSSNGYGDAGIS